MSIIEVKNLNFSYKSNPVLENVSFEIEKGDYVGILGPNGGGKTTLLKILIGLLQPQSGTVKIFGKEIQKLKDKSEIGYVPQRIAQDSITFPATVYEVVESGRVAKIGLFGRLGEADRKATDRALDIAGIRDLKDKLVGDLSGGQRQRVYVARALTREPQILILDEPFVGIDLSSQEDFYSFLKELNEKQKITILFVSHDIDMVSEEVKSVICLNRGLLCIGSTELLHSENVIEHLYGKKITHIHRSH